MVKLAKGIKKMYNDLEKEAIEVELTDKAGFKAMWEKIVGDFDEGESPQAVLAKKMGWPKKEEAQKFAIESLKTDLIQRMDMPLSSQKFMPFYLEPTQESEYDRSKKKWGKPYPVIRGAAIVYDDVEEELKLGVITAKRDSSKIARNELEVNKTYNGTFTDWTGTSEADVLGLAVAENSVFNESDEPIDVDPIEWLRDNYKRVMVKDARKNFTDPDDYLDFVLVEGEVVTSRVKSYKGSENRDGVLTIKDDSIGLLDMRKAQKSGVRMLVDVKTISPLEVMKIGKQSHIIAIGPMKNRDQFKDGSEDVERSWNPQVTTRALIITQLVEKEEEEEEPESEEEKAEDAGEVYAEAQSMKFDDDDGDEEKDEEEAEEEDEPEEEAEEEAEEEVDEEEAEEAGTPGDDEDVCGEYGTGYDPDDVACIECDDAEDCEEKSTAPKKKKGMGKKK